MFYSQPAPQIDENPGRANTSCLDADLTGSPPSSFSITILSERQRQREKVGLAMYQGARNEWASFCRETRVSCRVRIRSKREVQEFNTSNGTTWYSLSATEPKQLSFPEGRTKFLACVVHMCVETSLQTRANPSTLSPSAWKWICLQLYSVYRSFLFLFVQKKHCTETDKIH